MEKLNFKVSSFECGNCGCGCVGVAMGSDAVHVTNTTTPGPIAQFSRAEWSAFIAGVKNGEFDLV